jgi:probable HAF family extracellular repeat protein
MVLTKALGRNRSIKWGEDMRRSAVAEYGVRGKLWRYGLMGWTLMAGLPLASQAGGMVDLGTLGGPYSSVSAVSANGSVVVGGSSTGGMLGRFDVRHAFAWTQAGGMVDLGTLGGTFSGAAAVSADGSVVVGGANTAGDAASRAFRWTQAGGMVDLGTLGGGTSSSAHAVSADGSVVVGDSLTVVASHAFRWTQAGGMVDLGTLGGTYSSAQGVSADGSVAIGSANTAGDAASHAFRWTQAGGMVDLGTLGGTHSFARAISANGSMVVGESATAGFFPSHAFRWTQASGMVDLGTLGGTSSFARAVSADGSVVIGNADTAGDAAIRAFRWTQPSGMVDLGTLGGTHSSAQAASADGSVVIGSAKTAGDVASRAFRWTRGSGMQSVEDWLRASGVTVPTDITFDAVATNSDGSVVVGQLTNGHAFIARGASGLVTPADVQESLTGTAKGGTMALSFANLVLDGAHSRPLARRVASDQSAFWIAGDWGRDDYGSNDGDLGLAELGVGHNFGAVQINVSLGHTWGRQNQVMNGHAEADGTYLLAEALIPLAGGLWATVGGYGQRGSAELDRGYLNAGVPVTSSGKPDVDTWAVRARLDWEDAASIAGVGIAPYADLSYSEAKLAAYTENGGGFPARFDARRESSTQFRLGTNATKALSEDFKLIGTLEATHLFQKEGDQTTGEVIGLFPFDFAGQRYQRDWLRAGIGIEGRLAGGDASLMLNGTTKGEMPNTWVAASWQRAF